MAVSHDILDLGELLQRLRTVDRNYRVSGSEQHKYRLNPVLSESELVAFESAHRIKLPQDYRCFLAIIGNGGAGPFYGLEPLGAFGRDLSTPFPFTESTEQVTAEELGKLLDQNDYPGILELCHQGSAIYSYLVVNGPTYGTIWDGLDDFIPTGLSFSVWYRRWAERALRRLDNERLVPNLRVGMSKADVLTEVGGDWKERKALYRSIWYFESSEIPAQLELDEQGIVVKVNPWPFI